jgi:Holliday junction resolvase
VIFENNNDRENQSRLQWMLEYVGYEVEPTDTLHPYDFILYRNGGQTAIVEYKARDKLWDPIKIDRHKITQLVDSAYERGVKPIFIVGCPGPPYHWTHPHLNYKVSTFTRKKDAAMRGETPDQVFEIPKSEFNLL